MIWQAKSGADDWLKHEYGHYIQSQNWGYLYLLVFAIPSVINYQFGSDHNDFYTERDSSILGSNYFMKLGFPGATNRPTNEKYVPKFTPRWDTK